jgi:glycerol-3-phosphate dehydrogenase
VQGLLSIVSVKLTTARGVAEQAVDGVVARLGRRTAPCRTATTPLRVTESDGVELDARTRRAVRDEMALHLDDLLLRRLDLATAGMPAAGDVEAVLGALASERQLDAAGLGVERRRLERALAAAAR